MPTITLPVILQGPAYITHNGKTIFVQGDVAVKLSTATWSPATAYGPIGPRYKSRIATITCTPVGMVTASLLDYFYASFKTPSVAETLGVGKSVLAGSLVIVSQSTLKSYEWKNAGLTKAPSLHLGPGKTAYGSMEWTAIGSPTADAVAPLQWRTAEGTVVSNATGFEESAIITDVYTAGWGAGTGHTAMGSIDGFDLDFGMETKNVEAGDIGIADVILSGLTLSASFAPSSLTETQLDALVRLSAVTGAETLLPGQEIARGLAAGPGTPIPLVLTGTQLNKTFTVPIFGWADAEYSYQVGEHRLKKVVGHCARRWGTGLETSLFTHTVVDA